MIQLVILSSTSKLRKGSMRYITRLDYQGGDGGWTHGWSVRVPGQPTKFFGDHRHGGKRKSFKAAKLYRDLFPLPPVYRPGILSFYKKSRRNRSGVAGVAVFKNQGKPAGWMAYIGSHQYGTLKREVFISAEVGGSRKAKQLAIKCRRLWEKKAGK